MVWHPRTGRAPTLAYFPPLPFPSALAQALRQYRRASELDPGCKLALANQAAALLKLERWAEAEDLAGQVGRQRCSCTA